LALVVTRSEGADGQALVTGASGFIGQQLVQLLRHHGHPVITLTRPQHDLLQPDSLTGLLDGVDTVFHLAAYAHVNQINTEAMYAANVTGTANLLAAAVAAGVRHLVHVSSVLADPALDQPRTAYGDSKHQAEQLLTSAHARGDIRVTILRPVNVYGPGMKGNLMTLLRLIHKGWMPPLPAFQQGFSLIGVDDLCHALMRVAGFVEAQDPAPEDSLPQGTLPQVTAAEDTVPQTFNKHDSDEHPPSALVYTVSDGQVYRIKDLERAMREALGKSTPGWSTPAPVFYLGALGLEVVSRLFRLKNAPGLRSWAALSRNRVAGDAALWRDLGYNPRASFYSTLPAILDKAGLTASTTERQN
jgi:UDP-glucose 4-epimerase